MRRDVSATADRLGASFAGATITLSPATDASLGGALSQGLRVVDRTPQGEFFLRLTGIPGQEFIVEASDDLTTWTPIKTVTLNNETREFVDTEARGIPARFYRHRPVLKGE